MLMWTLERMQPGRTRPDHPDTQPSSRLVRESVLCDLFTSRKSDACVIQSSEA